MKRLLLAVLTTFVAGSAVAAPLDDFNTLVRPELVKPFALDLGGVLGSMTSPAGRPLGFPGFSIGVGGAVQFKPDQDNLILRNSGVKEFGLPYVEAAVALPLSIDVVAHGTKVGDFSAIGGGLRYGVFKSGTLTMAVPSLSLSGFYDVIDHDFFDGTHMAANAGAIWDKIPVIHPFAQAGLDYTKVEVSNMVANAGARGAEATARGYRLSLGADISPLPLFHVYGAYVLRHGISGADFGLSFSF